MKLSRHSKCVDDFEASRGSVSVSRCGSATLFPHLSRELLACDENASSGRFRATACGHAMLGAVQQSTWRWLVRAWSSHYREADIRMAPYVHCEIVHSGVYVEGRCGRQTHSSRSLTHGATGPANQPEGAENALGSSIRLLVGADASFASSCTSAEELHRTALLQGFMNLAPLAGAHCARGCSLDSCN